MREPGDTRRGGPIPKPVSVRLWAKVNKSAPNGCWEWNGARDPNGYGRIQVMKDGKWGARLTHRTAYELLKGPIPDDLHLCHRCDNPPCCNPDHLFPGTPLDNITDAKLKGRVPNRNTGHTQSAKTHCPKGHEYTKENTYTNPNKYERACIKCQREANRQFKAKVRALKQQELIS